MNGLLRFPVVVLYSVAGLLIGAFVVTHPEFLSVIQGKGADYGIANSEDLMVPIFILN